MSMTSLTARSAVALIAACVLCAGAAAQTWPDRPIKLIVNFPPGGSRSAPAHRTRRLEAIKQPVVVENRRERTGRRRRRGCQVAADGTRFRVRWRDDRRPVRPIRSSYDTQKGGSVALARDRARLSVSASVGAREKPQRVRRLRARQPRKAILRVSGQWQLPASRCRDVHARGEDRGNPRPVQGRCAGAQRPAGRAGAVHVRSRSGSATCDRWQVDGARCCEWQTRFTIP